MLKPNTIRIELIKRGKPCVWLAKEIGLHPSSLSGYLRGYTKMPKKIQAKIKEVLYGRA
jgi:hypothetical protein